MIFRSIVVADLIKISVYLTTDFSFLNYRPYKLQVLIYYIIYVLLKLYLLLGRRDEGVYVLKGKFRTLANT